MAVNTPGLQRLKDRLTTLLGLGGDVSTVRDRETINEQRQAIQIIRTALVGCTQGGVQLTVNQTAAKLLRAFLSAVRFPTSRAIVRLC